MYLSTLTHYYIYLAKALVPLSVEKSNDSSKILTQQKRHIYRQYFCIKNSSGKVRNLIIDRSRLIENRKKNKLSIFNLRTSI